MVQPEPENAPEVLSARFDWYAATILDSAQRVVDVLSAQLGASVIPDTGRHGYESGVLLKDANGDLLATVYYGGSFEWPHAFASSDQTDAFVDVVRSNWPNDHRVTRMDTALDFDNGPSTFSELFDLCQTIADGVRVEGDTRRRASKIKTRNVGDWTRGEDGRTYYLGSPKSAVFIRLYEKGIQLTQDFEIRGTPRTDISRNLVRLEVVVRPDKEAKTRAASGAPREAFGYADWTRELLRRVDGSGVKRVHIRERRLSDHERAFRWMLKQYRSHLITAAEEAGGWEALGLALERRIMDADHRSTQDFNDDETPF